MGTDPNLEKYRPLVSRLIDALRHAKVQGHRHQARKRAEGLQIKYIVPEPGRLYRARYKQDAALVEALAPYFSVPRPDQTPWREMKHLLDVLSEGGQS